MTLDRRPVLGFHPDGDPFGEAVPAMEGLDWSRTVRQTLIAGIGVGDGLQMSIRAYFMGSPETGVGVFVQNRLVITVDDSFDVLDVPVTRTDMINMAHCWTGAARTGRFWQFWPDTADGS